MKPRKMPLGCLGIALIYFTVAGAEVTLHWYMGQNSAPACSLRERYLSRDPHNGKRYVAGVVDFVIPSIILGVAAGIIGRGWTSGGLACCVLLLSIGVIGLWPVYDLLVPGLDPVWFGAKLSNRVAFLVFGPPRVVALCAVCAYLGRVLARAYVQRKPEC